VRHDDAALVETFLRALAAASEDGSPLPDADAIVRRACLRERLEEDQRRTDRAALPLFATTLLGPLAVILALAMRPMAAGATVLMLAAAATALAGAFALRVALIED
jgi:hypothetical protein